MVVLPGLFNLNPGIPRSTAVLRIDADVFLTTTWAATFFFDIYFVTSSFTAWSPTVSFGRLVSRLVLFPSWPLGGRFDLLVYLVV